ncbi:MAG TPA: class I SAM-dependent methyltransferase [Bryobacteraceae bacterium]|nr:class I SAM-dependent methyltransferase [Bryobacteraceae bacterium]
MEARRAFLDRYAIIRHAEGRGSEDPEYYRELPFRDISGRNAEQWRIRARSYRCFERVILMPQARRMGRPLRILDLGAGNGWMSHQLRLRGHYAVALDIFTDRLDGLGAIHHYETCVPGVAAEFDCLPFRDSAFDLVVFNSSLHYSPDYIRTLLEALRCLEPRGQLIIVDSPVYPAAEHGERMVAERQAHFEKTYGFRSDALGSIEYLDEGMLASLARELGLVWTRYRPWYGWRWALRPVRAKLHGKRPPSRFVILAGRFRTP